MKHAIKRILASICFCSLVAVSGFSEEKLSDKLTVEGFNVGGYLLIQRMGGDYGDAGIMNFGAGMVAEFFLPKFVWMSDSERKI